MNLKQLYYFKRLSETEHYTEAASSLCITQPSLSHAISELEKELGVALFARQGRNVKITQNGKRFLPYVEDALASLENGRMILQKNGAENKENIRISFIYTMGEYVVPQLINKYSLSPECHNVTFSFTQGTSLTLLQELKAGKVDLVETIHYPYIYFSENSGLRPFIDNVFMQQKLVPEIACYVDEDTAMAGLVSIDYGIAIMPRITALSYYNVHILKIKNTIPPRYIYLATMKDKGLSPALESFKNVVIHDSQKIC